jgi:hypothetical protein
VRHIFYKIFLNPIFKGVIKGKNYFNFGVFLTRFF